jgi:hypothetical protein
MIDLEVKWNFLFDYDSVTGDLIWANPSTNSLKVGDTAGSLDPKGHIRITVGTTRTSVHRIIWEMHNGKIPDGFVIDHIDCNKSNNRLENLRLANSLENARNRPKDYNSTSGYKGVTIRKNRPNSCRAAIKVNGVNINLGTFPNTPEGLREDARAYDAAAIKHHGDFVRLNFPL